MFEILNLGCDYLVLRSYEKLPNENEGNDIDFLTNETQRMASVLGIIQNPKQLYKGKINVAGKEINLDLRFVGDKYYDISWAKDMLDTKSIHNNTIYIPRTDHYFLSLLFHCKVQKPFVKNKYYEILHNLSKELNLIGLIKRI